MNEHYYNEIDPYCCKVLRARIADGNLPYGFVDERDIRQVQPADLAGYCQCHFFAGIGGFPLGLKWAGAHRIDGLWTGGFPCQDISLAGPRHGLAGERSGLYFELLRLYRDRRPKHAILENVSGIFIPIGPGQAAPLGRVLWDLAECGSNAEWASICSCRVGTPHCRARAWIIANSGSFRTKGLQWDSLSVCRNGPWRATGEAFVQHWPSGWASEAYGPSEASALICGEDDGIPNRLDRIAALGNAVVPQVVEYIGRALVESLTPEGK